MTGHINLSLCKFWKRLSTFTHSYFCLNFNLLILVIFSWNWNFVKIGNVGINPYLYKKSVNIRMLIIQNLLMSVSVIQTNKFKCSLPFKSLSWSFLVTLGWAWPSSCPACLLYLGRQNRAPTRSWVQGPHMVISIPAQLYLDIF